MIVFYYGVTNCHTLSGLNETHIFVEDVWSKLLRVYLEVSPVSSPVSNPKGTGPYMYLEGPEKKPFLPYQHVSLHFVFPHCVLVKIIQQVRILHT